MSEQKNAIANYIKDNWDSETIISAWNNYCSDECMDDYIHDNDEYFFNEMFSKTDDAIRAVCFGEYKYNDTYVVFNGYGNLDTFDFWDDVNSPIDLDTLTDWIIDNGDSNIDEIDSDYLTDCFIDSFMDSNIKNDYSREDIQNIVNDYLEEEDFDFLTEDWEDMNNIIREKLSN